MDCWIKYSHEEKESTVVSILCKLCKAVLLQNMPGFIFYVK